MSGYAHPEALVSTEWVAGHHKDPSVRVLEVDYAPDDAYHLWHVPGAHLVDWKTEINDQVRRDIVSKAGFEALMGRVGATPETTLVLYGDNRNWFAAYALWTFKIYGHRDVRLMDGGRRKWVAEKRETSQEAPAPPSPTTYAARGADLGIRSFMPDVRALLGRSDVTLVDVRGPAEFTGEILAPPEYPNEGGQRGGHIPGAQNIPWVSAVNQDTDDTFKSADQLRALYAAKGVTEDKSVITYCRIGERSSHTWFVLRYLLGFPVVSNYDGSWSEWGNSVGAPVER